MGTTRRAFIRRTGAGLAVGTAALGMTGSAAASHLENVPEHVTIEYSEDLLNRYRPRLVFPTEARDKLIGLYGWVARSNGYDTDALVYWCKYTHQEGWAASLDSHWGDHEPLCIEVDSQTGEVVRLRASVYHWLKGEVTGESIPMYDDTHPMLRVIAPWHQYTAPQPADSGAFVDVRDLTDAGQGLDAWLANGLEESLYQGSCTEPWVMRSRPSWWRNSQVALGIDLPFSLDAATVRTARRLGVGKAGTLEAPA